MLRVDCNRLLERCLLHVLGAVPLGRVVNWESFNNFVDRIDPEYQNAPGSGDSPLDTLIEQTAETEYLIKSIYR